jgi:putative IMPACT (imprinted ancient) family translation regulator
MLRGSETLAINQEETVEVRFEQTGQKPGEKIFTVRAIYSDINRGEHLIAEINDDGLSGAFNAAKAKYLEYIGALYVDGWR